MRGKRKLHERLLSAGKAYVVLGLLVSVDTIGQYAEVREHTAGLVLKAALEFHSLVFTTVLLLSVGAVTMLAGVIARRFNTRL